jgi:hypothetical protein
MGMMRTMLCPALILAAVVSSPAAAQTPVPFPRPGQPPPAQLPIQVPPQPGQAQPERALQPGEPDRATLGVGLYPDAQFITSYDAGRGPRYYLFGSSADFAIVVAYYKNILKQRGELVFEEPPVHMFDLGRFREETMAFPPSLTVKDYTWGGSLGYLNPKRGATPARYRTIIQVVPNPPAAPGR